MVFEWELLHPFILSGNLCELPSSPFAFLPLSLLSFTSQAIFSKVPSKCHNHQTTTANNGNALVTLPKALIYQRWIMMWPALILGSIFHNSGRGKRTVLRFCCLFSRFSFDLRLLYKHIVEKPYSPNQMPVGRIVPADTERGTFPFQVLLHMLHRVP